MYKRQLQDIVNVRGLGCAIGIDGGDVDTFVRKAHSVQWKGNIFRVDKLRLSILRVRIEECSVTLNHDNPTFVILTCDVCPKISTANVVHK